MLHCKLGRVLLFRLIPGCDNLGEILVLSVRVGGECLRQPRAGYGTVFPLSLSLSGIVEAADQSTHLAR
jgi:hypothetical protein